MIKFNKLLNYRHMHLTPPILHNSLCSIELPIAGPVVYFYAPTRPNILSCNEIKKATILSEWSNVHKPIKLFFYSSIFSKINTMEERSLNPLLTHRKITLLWLNFIYPNIYLHSPGCNKQLPSAISHKEEPHTLQDN